MVLPSLHRPCQGEGLTLKSQLGGPQGLAEAIGMVSDQRSERGQPQHPAPTSYKQSSIYIEYDESCGLPERAQDHHDPLNKVPVHLRAAWQTGNVMVRVTDDVTQWSTQPSGDPWCTWPLTSAVPTHCPSPSCQGYPAPPVAGPLPQSSPKMCPTSQASLQMSQYQMPTRCPQASSPTPRPPASQKPSCPALDNQRLRVSESRPTPWRHALTLSPSSCLILPFTVTSATQLELIMFAGHEGEPSVSLFLFHVEVYSFQHR